MEQISMVFQNVYLFADTIENNIKFGRPQATHAEVVEAARKACCADFIEALPDGYDTVIGEGGASLSGGSGTIRGTLVGCIFTGILMNSMTLLGISDYWQYVVRGSLIVFAVFLNTMVKEALEEREK